VFHGRRRAGLPVKLAGADPDFHRRDLWEAIEAGAFPEWDLAVQTFDQELADTLPYDLLDATKLIPEEIVPLQVVGRMVLDRNPYNFFAESEQVAFMPTNIVSGIDFSDDPLLQGRLFSISTRRSRASARRTSIRSPSMRRSARSATSSATGSCRPSS
jgi:catalase